MEYLSLNQYLKERFGCKIYKLSIDGGFTCPNRDGSLGDRGCIFCSGSGSGDFATDRKLTITEQIEKAKERVAGKMKSCSSAAPNSNSDSDSKLEKTGKYIAYFQAFTNTYAEVDVLRDRYLQAINHPEVVAISIGTRPDCLGEDVLALLDEMNHIKPVWVELGLQTIHEETAKYIRRGYNLQVYDRAMDELKKLGIYVVTHVILGLPGETTSQMLETVRYVCDRGTDGIKLQLLHVIKGTDLEKSYLTGEFQCLTLEEYVQLIRQCVSIIPRDIAIHRLTGDGDKRTLVAPLWSGDKKKVLNAINRALQS